MAGGRSSGRGSLAQVAFGPAGRPAGRRPGAEKGACCLSSRRLAKNRFALGSPAQVIEALLAQHKAGVTHATMRVSWPGMRQDDILAGIDLLGREVLPEVRRRTSPGTG